MLTRKQSELLRLIHSLIRNGGVPPSFDEMKDALGLRSKSGIFRLLNALEDRGFIRRLPHRARAIEVLRLPEPPPGPRRSFAPDVIEGTPRHAVPGHRDGAAVAILIRGRINVSALIEVLQTHYGTINVLPGSSHSGALCTIEIQDGPEPPTVAGPRLR
ncbi:MAG: hypothetical protein FWD68_04385 [Alphaproteobacteria bacterium]|nr:hypothetical protein [Alphaproteobacteria bacterium]